MYIMTKAVGPTCNMACEYCYYLEKAKLYSDKPQHLMSDKTLERFIQQYPNSTDGYVYRAHQHMERNDFQAADEDMKLAVSMLEKAGVLFKKVLATENVELTNKYGVKQAPTLVVLGAGEDYEKFRGVSEIKGMLTARQAV